MAEFESTGQILDRSLSEIVCSRVRLTPESLQAWQADDKRRSQNRLESRGMALLGVLEVDRIDESGVWVRCPMGRIIGEGETQTVRREYAHLSLREFEFVAEEAP